MFVLCRSSWFVLKTYQFDMEKKRVSKVLADRKKTPMSALYSGSSHYVSLAIQNLDALVHFQDNYLHISV